MGWGFWRESGLGRIEVRVFMFSIFFCFSLGLEICFVLEVLGVEEVGVWGFRLSCF